MKSTTISIAKAAQPFQTTIMVSAASFFIDPVDEVMQFAQQHGITNPKHVDAIVHGFTIRPHNWKERALLYVPIKQDKPSWIAKFKWMFNLK